jgi:hypothetical protein
MEVRNSFEERHAYSVRVEFLRPKERSYDRLSRDMYKNGFRHMFKDRNGEWVQLPRGSFVISTADSPEIVKKRAMRLATALDSSALVKLAPIINWAA